MNKKLLIPVLALGAVAMAAGGRRRARAERAARPADVRAMHAMHAAFRRDLDRLRRWSGPGLPEGWEVLRRQLEFHHRAEDDDLWPVVRAKVSSPAIDEMAAEHAEIPEALDAVDRARVDRRRLTTAIDELAALVTAHLDHEEDEVLPLIEAHLTDEEWHRWLITERDKAGPRAGAEWLGWVLDNASQRDREAILRQLPGPGRAVYRLVLAPRYRRRHLWDNEGHRRSATRAPRAVA